MRGSAARRWCVWLVGAVLMLVAGATGAQQRGLPAVISVGSSGLDARAVQRAVEHELGVALVIEPNAGERLEVAMTGRRANVTYYAPGRDPVTRSVDLPKGTERALETIAFLAGNLARDEAAELLRQLNPNAAGNEPDEVPRAEPPPPPPPAPAPPPPVREKPPAPAPAPASTSAKPAELALIEPDRFAANLSLLYPTAALKHTERRRLNLELGILSSRIGALRGAAFSLGYLRVDGPVEGFSSALFVNRAGPVTGAQLAGFVAVVRGSVLGAQGAGIAAIAGDVQGAQGGVVVSVARDVKGAQGSTVAAVARDVEGFQGSLANVARRVRGLQLGLVNVADEIHGGAIGLVSIAKNGRLQPTVWLPGPGSTLVAGLKSVTDLTYTQIGFGYDPFSDRYREDGSLGLHLELGHRFYGETGFGYDETQSFRGGKTVRSEVRYDARIGFEPIHGITPFVGGSLTRRLSGGGADYLGEYCFGLSLL
jgi:hypothetical protein